MSDILRYSFILFIAIANPALPETVWPESFGLGRPVAADEIAAWDIDVRPDGHGLPLGAGSVAQGAQTFTEKCAFCHGESGVEGPFDVLVGRLPNDSFPFGRIPGTVKTIGNYWPYATTVFDYINRAMPFNAPGSLTANEVYALVAYLLHRNDIVPADTILSADNLASITMPAKQRFVPDDRHGGAEVR